MIDELPEVPDPASDTPQAFSQKAAAMVLAQKAMVPQINRALADMNALQAGGAYALPYIFDTPTTDADPGAGKLRLSSAAQNTATVMRLDLTAGGQDYTALIDTMDASSSPVKGSIRLVKQGDLSKWMTFDVTARAAPTGYRNLAVVCTDSSSASPFAKDDLLLLFFQRSGDKGETGFSGMPVLATATVTSAVANIDFLNVFSAAYDKYTIEVQGIACSGAGPTISASILLSLAVAGAIPASPLNAGMSGGESNLSNSTSPLFVGATGNPAVVANAATSFTVEIRNVNSNFPKSVSSRGLCMNSGSAFNAWAREGASLAQSPLSGFRLTPSSGNFIAGTIRIFGHRNT